MFANIRFRIMFYKKVSMIKSHDNKYRQCIISPQKRLSNTPFILCWTVTHFQWPVPSLFSVYLNFPHMNFFLSMNFIVWICETRDWRTQGKFWATISIWCTYYWDISWRETESLRRNWRLSTGPLSVVCREFNV